MASWIFSVFIVMLSVNLVKTAALKKKKTAEFD